jgi:DSBA-like thioredoxin domain
MPSQTFAITWDYRCPFARNAHEHVLEALEAGADWDVTFVPFSLGQVHVAEGDPDIWETPEKDSGLLALQVGVAVRDLHPDQFRPVHRALFALRHDEGKALNDRDLIAKVLTDNGVDSDAVFEHVDAGAALATLKAEHTAAAADHKVWGVPTFIAHGEAVFVRYMHRPAGDAGLATKTIERTLDLLTWPDLNEYKHTSIPR